MYCQNKGMEFGREKSALQVMKSRKRHIMDGTEKRNQDKNKKGKPANTWVYLKLTPSNKCR